MSLVCLGLASPAGAEPIGSQFRVSLMGPDGDADTDAFQNDAAYNPGADQYLVVWSGDDVDNNGEIFGRFVSGAGVPATNDFRISDMGGDAGFFQAVNPAVVYNPQANEYLIVWSGDDNTPPLVDNEFEIFGQRLSPTGAELGTNDFRISQNGPNGDTDYSANRPAIAYNPDANQYLVTWHGDHDFAAVNDEFEIFGQRLNADSSPSGFGIRISHMGPDFNTDYGAFTPSVAYSTASDEYLVVWVGDHNAAPLVDDEFEIFGHRLTATGITGGDFRISDMGPDSSVVYSAGDPDISYNPAASEYLVAWEGNESGLAIGEYEIFGQRLTSTAGATGANDFRISDMGPDVNSTFNASEPELAYASGANEYMLVWSGDDNTPPLVDEENELFGQRLDAAGGAIGSNDFRISQMGPDGNAAYDVANHGITYNSLCNEFLPVWQADDNAAVLADDEFEIYARRSSAGGPAPCQAVDGAPNLTVKARKKQRLARQKGVKLRAKCDEPCSLKVTGRVKIKGEGKKKLRKLRRELAANKFTRLKAKLRRKTVGIVKEALEDGRKVIARLTVTATDAAGNATKKKLRVRGKK